MDSFGFTKLVILHLRYSILPNEIDDQILLESFNYLTFVGERRALVQKGILNISIYYRLWSVECGVWSVEY